MSASKILKYSTSVVGGVKTLTMITKTGETHEITDDDIRFERTRNYAAESLWNEVYDQFLNESAKKMVRDFGGTVVDGSVRHRDGSHAVPELLGAIEKLSQQGIATGHLDKFMKKLESNPVEHVRNNMFKFIKHHNIKICDDGDFLAVKIVRDDYTDCWTGTIYNRPGDEVHCDWDAVEINPERPCSKGLHVCAPHYLKGWTGGTRRIVLVKQDPSRIGSIPNDYTKFSKIRGTGYTVVSDITDEFHTDMDLSKLNLGGF